MNNDQASSVFFLVAGIAICMGSVTYRLGSFSSPSSGFMPFLAGLAVVVLALIGFIDATLKKRKGEEWLNILKGIHWEKSFGILALLALYTIALVPIGFLVSTFLFVALLLKTIVPQRWSITIMGSILSAFASYLIFDVWLKAQLPKGPWGF